MARRKSELVEEAVSLGIAEKSVAETCSTERLMDLIRDKKCGTNNLLPQIAPMLCRDAKDFLDYSLHKPWESKQMDMFWDDPDWIAEEKIDGCRFKMHFTEGGVRIDSRRRSDVSYAYQERTDNFPQFDKAFPRELVGTILDGEILMPYKKIDTGSVVTDGVLQATVAVCNSSPERSREIQDRYGPAKFIAFDVVDFDNDYFERRDLLQSHLFRLWDKGWNSTLIHNPDFCDGDKKRFFELCLFHNKEGVVFKKYCGMYEQGKRSKFNYKLKRFSTVDCFVSGYIPGEHGFEGLVGALKLSVCRNEATVEVGAVSQLTLEQRKALSSKDGSLVPEAYKRVVEVRYQELTKTNRMRHAVLVGFRNDKDWIECKGFDIFGD